VASKPSGDLAGALQAHVQAARLAKATGSILLAVSALTCQGDVLIEQARLHQAVETYREALQLATLPNEVRLPAAGRVFVCLAKVYYEWNDLDEVARCSQRGIELCRQGGMVEHLAVGHLFLARARQAQGNLEGAQEAVQEVERMALEQNLPAEVTSSCKATRVRLWLALGDLEEAVRWARESGLTVDDPVSYIREPEYVTLLRVFLAQGDPDAVLTLTGRWLHAAETTGRTGQIILFLAFQALAWLAKENVPRALVALERALSLAKPEGYVRTFLDGGAPMIALLRHAGSRGIAPDDVARLLSEIVEAPGVVPPAQPLIEPLSERELQVLCLLSEGKSNQAIADELVLATGTVKRHLYNIYGKLNVRSRLECVARTRELGLL
jgi:LuxR family maltose regulon positive regulatory protein